MPLNHITYHILVANESVIQPDTLSETSMDLEVDENPLDKCRIGSNETSLISNLFYISVVWENIPEA